MSTETQDETTLAEPSHKAKRRALRELRRKIHLPKLSTGIKVFLLFAGWFLVLLGLLGLVLPVLQGVLFLTLGAAVLSLVSSTAFLALRRLFGRWPRGWRKLLAVRRRMHDWLEKKLGRKPDEDPAPEQDPRDAS